MVSPSPVGVPKVTNLSHAILTMLNSVDPTSETGCHASAASPVTIDTLFACAKLDDVGADVHAAPLAHAALSNGHSNIDIGDWGELFHAVTSRLRLTVGEPLAVTPVAQAHDAAAGVQTIVLECVAALDQLHAALTYERGRREHLEREVFNAQAALARALANSLARRPQIACSPASASLPVSQQHQQVPLS
ncbi:MAG: hypothetical protein JJD98_16940 [Polaromonas sp.]|nr:hypothetical protein [Polaromonas sp.]